MCRTAEGLPHLYADCDAFQLALTYFSSGMPCSKQLAWLLCHRSRVSSDLNRLAHVPTTFIYVPIVFSMSSAIFAILLLNLYLGRQTMDVESALVCLAGIPGLKRPAGARGLRPAYCHFCQIRTHSVRRRTASQLVCHQLKNIPVRLDRSICFYFTRSISVLMFVASSSGKRNPGTSSTTVCGHTSKSEIAQPHRRVEADPPVAAASAVQEDIEWPWEPDAASSSCAPMILLHVTHLQNEQNVTQRNSNLSTLISIDATHLTRSFTLCLHLVGAHALRCQLRGCGRLKCSCLASLPRPCNRSRQRPHRRLVRHIKYAPYFCACQSFSL